MGRPSSPESAVAVGVRAALIAKFAGHVRETLDPRCSMDPDWQRPRGYRYVDPMSKLLKDLEAGKPVDVRPGLLQGIADVPPGCRLVRVDARGVVTAAPYERVT